MNPIFHAQHIPFEQGRLKLSFELLLLLVWYFIDFPNDDEVLNKPPNIQYHLQFAFTFLSNRIYHTYIDRGTKTASLNKTGLFRVWRVRNHT